MAKLTHANAVQEYSFGQFGHQPFLVMGPYSIATRWLTSIGLEGDAVR